MNSGKVIVGILASIAAGAALGVLFAPEKGLKIRKKILKKGERVSGDLEEKYHAFISGVKDKYESLGHDAAQLAKAGLDQTEKILKEVSANGKS